MADVHALRERAGPGSPAEDVSAWYDRVVREAELADDGPAEGAIAIRPYGFRIWELIRAAVDETLRRTGHRNLSLPLLVPGSVLERQAERVEGFVAPETAAVTRAGGETLGEPLVVRPACAASLWPVVARWIEGRRDLPLLLNQWAEVVEWEPEPRPFLRSRESLRQEAHTGHASPEAAESHARRMLGEYRRFMDRWMALGVVTGEASPASRLPGAEATYACETLVRDGGALRVGSQHLLGQRFSRAFEVRFRREDGELEYVWNTSGVLSTRLIGALVLAHGDDRGLVLPPRLAPHQAVILPSWDAEGQRALLLEVSERIRRVLSREVRVHVDEREEPDADAKARQWERRGVPLLIRVDPEGVSRQRVEITRRFGQEGTWTVKEAEALSKIPRLLEEMQRALAASAPERRRARSVRGPEDLQALAARMHGEGGLAYAGWCGSQECEARAARETGAAIRLLPDPEFRSDPAPEACLVCGGEVEAEALWARPALPARGGRSGADEP